ncbi:polysaccharide pyruvyl transferase family protein [Aerococcus urinaeequi]|uniref:polysaccharide pyruvyl transferase family protein n=1 Tax=Aerococcus urinaeequi TaxID=51665 RepID=UPI003D6BB7F1
MSKFIIIPTTTDLNRGDQALVWESRKMVDSSQKNDEFFILTEDKESGEQSENEGFTALRPILKHPGRKSRKSNNEVYGLRLILSWGLVAIFDLVFSLLLLNKLTRKISKKFISQDTKRTLEIYEKADAFFVKGGGFIHSSGKLTDTYTVYYQVYNIFLAHALDKKVYILPNSFGPFKGMGVKWLVKKAFNMCEIVTVRESISQQMVAEIGVDSELYPDLGFGLQKSNFKYKKLEEIKSKYTGFKFVGITARPYRFPNSDNPEQAYINYVNEFATTAKWLFDNNFLPIFIEQTLSETTHESDISAIKDITKNLNTGTYSIISDASLNSRELKKIYSQMDYVIGTRFHSVIFSLSENVPAIAVTYGGNKGQGIMRDIGYSEFAIPMGEVDSNALITKFKKLVKNTDKIKLGLSEEMKKILAAHEKLSSKISKEM